MRDAVRDVLLVVLLIWESVRLVRWLRWRRRLPQRARGIALTRIGMTYNLVRRWRGWEPDALYRRRVLREFSRRNYEQVERLFR